MQSIPLAQQGLLDTAALCQRYHCTTRTLYTWEQTGRLPRSVRIGRRKLWRLADLLAAEGSQQ